MDLVDNRNVLDDALQHDDGVDDHGHDGNSYWLDELAPYSNLHPF